MIDTHCHLNDKSYDLDLDEVIKSAFAAGVENIIVPATNPNDLEKTLKIAEKDERIFAAVGVHPHDAKRVNSQVLEKINELANNKKVKAIGEIGLDYHYEHSPKKEQIFALEKQFEIAQNKDLPILLHNRESDEDMISFLKSNRNENTKGVLHCFSSDMKMLENILDMNFYVAFTANITFAKTNLDEVVKNTPLDKLLLETDSPYMTPPPNRGKRNVPQTVKIVAEKISKIKNISIEEVIKMTTENAKKLFRISLILFVFLFGKNVAYSQADNTDEEYYYEDEDYEYEQADRFVRRLGFGPIFGTNTFVDMYKTGWKSFSQEGLFAFGGLINYRITEPLIIQAGYTYAKNTKIIERLPEDQLGTLDPNYHQAFELSAIWMLKPRNAFNFYGSAGLSYFMNELSRNFTGHDKHYFDDNALGMNAGIGAFYNISLGSGGTMTIYAEWKIGFRFDKVELDYDPREAPGNSDGTPNPKYAIHTEYSSISSIPRGGIVWYMPFLK
jgi:TatD DNase family protein